MRQAAHPGHEALDALEVVGTAVPTAEGAGEVGGVEVAGGLEGGLLLG